MMIRTIAAFALMVLTVWTIFEHETGAQEQAMLRAISAADKP